MKFIRSSAAGRLALVASALAWGVSFAVLKNLLDAVPVLWVLSFRFLGAFLLLFLFSIGRLKHITLRELRDGAVIGVLLFVAYVLQTYGLAMTTPGRNAFLTAIYCVLTPFLGWSFGEGKPDRWNISAAVICFAGVGFLSLERSGLFLGMGDLLTLLCGAMFAAHILLTSRYVKRYDILTITMIEFGVAGILAAGSGLAFEPLPVFVSLDTILVLVYLCVVCTALCFFLQNFGESRTPPSAAAVILSLEALFGVAFSLLLGMETLTSSVIIGFSLIFFAVLMSETRFSFLKPLKRR